MAKKREKSYESQVLLHLNAKLLFYTIYLNATKDNTFAAQNIVYYINNSMESQGQFKNQH